MWDVVRKILAAAFAAWTLSRVGPPMVDQYFLPTIDYIADSFLAVAPQPPSPTAFMQMQPPMAAASAMNAFQTTFVKQAAFDMGSELEQAMVTDIHNYSYFSPEHDGPIYGSSRSVDWSFFIQQTAQTLLIRLRNLFDNLLVQSAIWTALIISWQLYKRHMQASIRNILDLHNLEKARLQDESSASTSAKDLEIAALNEQIKAHECALIDLESLLSEARKEIDAKLSAEEQSRTEIKHLNSRLKDKEIAIAERDGNLAEATWRAEKAEKSNAGLGKDAKRCRSDFESSLQKKNNDIESHQRASDQAKKNEEATRRELKEARTEAGKDRKRISELERQVTGFEKTVTELQTQIQSKDMTLVQKDGQLKNLDGEIKAQTKNAEQMTTEKGKSSKESRDAKVKDEKTIDELRAQVAEAKNLRKDTEAKLSRQEVWATQAREELEAARLKVSEQDIEIFQRIQQGTEKDATLKAQNNRIEALTGQIADLLEQGNARREEPSNTEEKEVEAGDKEGEHGAQVEIQSAPLDTEKGSEGSQIKPKKVRCNRRPDGSIRTAHHPQYTLPTQRAVGQKQPDEEPRLLDVSQYADVQGEAKPSDLKPTRRVCPYFPHGNCRFGSRCLDLHESPASSNKLPKPSQEPSSSSHPRLLPPTTSAAPQADEKSQPCGGPFDAHPERPTCAFFKRGYCKFGAKCRDHHNLSQGSVNSSTQPAP